MESARLTTAASPAAAPEPDTVAPDTAAPDTTTSSTTAVLESASPAQKRAAVTHCFRPGADPIAEVQEKTRRGSRRGTSKRLKGG